MVMAMNVRQRHRETAGEVRRKAALPRYPLPLLLATGMTAGYLIGCCCGANAALPDSSGPVLSFLQSGGAGDTLYGGLLPELCISCAYGFAFFAAVDVVSRLFTDPRRFRCQRFSAPPVRRLLFALRLRTRVCPVVHCGRFARCVVVPALFLLGVLCAQMSVRLMEQRRGLPSPAATERCSRGWRWCSACCLRLRPRQLCRAVFHKLIL